MRRLGFMPVPGSGSGWVNKEDGESDWFMAQLKSTDKNSFTIKREDIDKLEYHAMVSHKVPVFVNEFLGDGEIYLTINLKDLEEGIKYHILSQGPQSPSDKQNNGSNIIYHHDIFDSSECHSGPLDMVSNMDHISTKKMIRSEGREEYQKIRDEEIKKANADFKANRRKRNISK